MGDAAEDVFDKVLKAEIDLHFCIQDHYKLKDEELISILDSVVTYEDYQPDEFTHMMKDIIEQWGYHIILYGVSPKFTEKKRNAIVTHICRHQEE